MMNGRVHLLRCLRASARTTEAPVRGVLLTTLLVFCDGFDQFSRTFDQLNCIVSDLRLSLVHIYGQRENLLYKQ